MARRKRIQSGTFRALNRNQISNNDCANHRKLEVNRIYVPTTYDTNNEPVTITFKMAYYLENPELLTSTNRPLICLHGGPGIPHNYLKNISKNIKNRTVIFYDQIGCGKSSEPCDINAYSIGFLVDDLEKLVKHLQLETFHLYGHSFGGILAFEFAKMLSGSSKEGPSQLLSLTLASAPFDVHAVDEDSEKKMDYIQGNRPGLDASSLFHKTFMCRTDVIPSDLGDAFMRRGKVWQGTDVIKDYIANTSGIIWPMPPTLLLRGEFDFVSPTHSQENWKQMLDHFARSCKMSSLAGCSHYGMLEDDVAYCNVLLNFISDFDQKTDEQ